MFNIRKASIYVFLLLASLTCQADRGEELYTENCAICHGHQGTGGVGIPLGLQSFLQQVPDEYLRRTIRLGRPGRIMPAFYRLSDNDIDDIIQHIRSWKKTRIPSWDGTPVKGNRQQGEQLFNQHCVTCHGENARGGKGTGLMFSRQKDQAITAPALNNQGFLNSASDQMIKQIITHGRKQTPMPPASQFKLSERDINHLVSYIRGFQKPMVSRTKMLDEPPVLIYDSPYSFAETIENIKRAAVGMNFRLIRDQALDYGFVPEEQESRKHTMIYFCNFNFLYQALAIDPRVGMFLPCRITVVEQNNHIQVMSINPKRLSQLFNNNELDEACDQMHEAYTSILEEATL